ncbi:hypothetical protein D9M72_469940 [compost metagenome]
MSIASMKAEPMMPNMSVTPLAAIVSTKASDGVMVCGPAGTWLSFAAAEPPETAGCLVVSRSRMAGVSWLGCYKVELYVPKNRCDGRNVGGRPADVNKKFWFTE